VAADRGLPRGTDPRRKSPLLACVLSAIPGLGQVYVGYYRRGFVHIAIFVVLFSLLVNEFGGNELSPLFTFSTIFFFLYNLVDAGRRASLYNLALDGIEQVEMPSDFTMPAFQGPRGSVLGGVVLIVAGTALFLYTKFDVPLDWVREWWPIGVVAIGVYLVVMAIRDRATADTPPQDRASSDRQGQN
jgi:hypothetical protein